MQISKDWREAEYEEYHDPPDMFDSGEEQDAFYQEFIEPKLPTKEENDTTEEPSEFQSS